MICASAVSAPTWVARIVNAPVVLTVAPMTASPACLVTGRLSPVTIDSSIVEVPSVTSPSTRDLLARPHPQQVADLHLVDSDLAFLPVADHPRGGRGEVDERADGVAGAGAGAGLDEPAEQGDGEDEADDLVVDLADVLGKDLRDDGRHQAVGERGDHAEGDEAVHLGASVAECPPADRVDRPADVEEHRQGEQQLRVGVLEDVGDVLLADEVHDHRGIQHGRREQSAEAERRSRSRTSSRRAAASASSVSALPGSGRSRAGKPVACATASVRPSTSTSCGS